MSARRQARAERSGADEYPVDRLPHRLRSGYRYRAAFTRFSDSGFYGPEVWALFVADDEKCTAFFRQWLADRGISASPMDETYRSTLNDAVERHRAIYGLAWARAYGEKLLKEVTR